MVCEKLAKTGPMSLSLMAATLANGLATDTLFCDLLISLHLYLEYEVDVEFKRTSTASVIALADVIQHALPALGRSSAFAILLASYFLAATVW